MQPREALPMVAGRVGNQRCQKRSGSRGVIRSATLEGVRASLMNGADTAAFLCECARPCCAEFGDVHPNVANVAQRRGVMM